MHTFDEDDFALDESAGDYCGVVTKVVAQKRALALDPTDDLYENHCGKLVAWTGEGFDYGLDNLEWAEKAMNSYEDGNNSWMTRHLNVPAEVAFKIRQYVTPPPVFYVQEGDLVLVVEESLECEWNKTLIFRKVE